MIPDWLRRHLEVTGRSNPDGVSRSLRPGRCRHCHAPVIRGLDGDILATPATCDAQLIDQVGELLALSTGRTTYDVTGPTLRPQLDPRRPAHIHAERRYPVLAEHRCGQPLPAAPTPPDTTGIPQQEPAW